MTDTNSADTATPETPVTPPVDRSKELKEALKMGLHQQYISLANYVNKLQGHPQLRMHFFQNFDQAMFWAEQYIDTVNTAPPPPAPVAPDAPPPPVH